MKPSALDDEQILAAMPPPLDLLPDQSGSWQANIRQLRDWQVPDAHIVIMTSDTSTQTVQQVAAAD